MKALIGALLLSALSLPASAQEKRLDPIQSVGDDFILNFSESQQDQISLLDFVNLAQEATGYNFTYDTATGTKLGGAKVVMLGTKRFPKSEFYNFFQIQLFINDFVCVEIGPPQISVIMIQDLSQAGQRAGGGGALGKSPTFVLSDDLPEYIDQ